jgi:hypothetical protein
MRTQFDLDGDFWRPLLTERGYGDAIDPPDLLPFGLASFAPSARAGVGVGSEMIEIRRPDVPGWIGQTLTAVAQQPPHMGEELGSAPLSIQAGEPTGMEVDEKDDMIQVIDIDEDEREVVEVIDVDEGVEVTVE